MLDLFRDSCARKRTKSPSGPRRTERGKPQVELALKRESDTEAPSTIIALEQYGYGIGMQTKTKAGLPDPMLTTHARPRTLAGSGSDSETVTVFLSPPPPVTSQLKPVGSRDHA